MESDVVGQGREAWARIKDRSRATFDDWVAVGKACAIGRAESLKLANTNRPYGKTYTKFMTSWLDRTGLSDLHTQERYWALQIVDNLAAITRWRDGLDDAKRRRLNHPQAIWINWRGTTSPNKPVTRAVRADAAVARKGRSIFFPQDMIRRGAMAMREARTKDLFALTRTCLEAAIRSEADISELLPDAPDREPRSDARSAVHEAA